MGGNAQDLIAESERSISAAYNEVIRICSVGERTRMSIPADVNRDTDLILSAALENAKSLVTALREAQATIERVHFAVDWLDTARSEGAVYTFGQIQEALRRALSTLESADGADGADVSPSNRAQLDEVMLPYMIGDNQGRTTYEMYRSNQKELES